MATSESKGRFFLQNESIRIDSHNESNRIDSNRELECSSINTKYAEIAKLYILWNELSRRKLSPTLASAHYSCPDNVIGIVGGQLGGNFLITTNVYVDKKLSYRRGTVQCVVSVEILPVATQQCRNCLYDKS